MLNRKLIGREEFIATSLDGVPYAVDMEFWKIENAHKEYVVYFYCDNEFDFELVFPFFKYAASPEFFLEWSFHWLSTTWSACTIVRCSDEG